RGNRGGTVDWGEGISRSRDVPVYRQIIERVTRLARGGAVVAGERLPTERELAERIGVARGTITRAYEELERDGIVEVVRGSGTYIAQSGGQSNAGRKERAMELIDNTIRGMLELEFSLEEIRTYVQVKLLEREQQLREFNLAGIDCNPEAMAIYENQLLYVSRSWMHKILLSELKAHPTPEALLHSFDLILTTSTHYREVLELAPALKEKIFQAAVSPSPDTIASLASLGRKSRIALLTVSPRFAEIIERKLGELRLSPNIVRRALVSDQPDLIEFLADIDGVIIPPGVALEQLPNHRAALPRFKEGGGWFIEFTHQIERGSLIYLEERISALLTR
ncbi:MAG: GntR family transcriptional regulator, partial [Spirochaetaceae bacterium]